MLNTKALAFAVAVLAVPGLTLAAEKKPLPKDLPPFGADKPLPVPAIAQSKLPNGLVVWLVKRSGFPRAAVVLAVRGAGTAADPKDAEGLTELLAAAIKEGTATRTSRAIAEELQAVGAEIDANGTADALYVTAGGLGSGVPKIVEVMADVVRNASYPAAEVELAKGNALQGSRRARGHAGVPGPEGPRARGVRRSPVPHHGAVEGDPAGRHRGPAQAGARAAPPSRPRAPRGGRRVRRRRGSGRHHSLLRHLARHRGSARRGPAIARGGGRASDPRRPAGRLRSVPDRDGSPRRHRHRPRLLPAAGRQHHLRRIVRQPSDREHPRG